MSRISTRGSARLSLILLGAILLALTIYLQFAAVNLAERMEGGDDVAAMRATFAAVTWRAALSFLPLGSGFGSFAPIYDIFSPQALLGHRYVNHAHDDWLELLLIGGVPAIAFAGCFLVWFGAAISRLWWGREASRRACDLQRAASVVVLLLLVHSAVDYPLRTTALSVLFALGCAFLLQPARLDDEADVAPSAAHLPGKGPLSVSKIDADD